MGIILHTVTHKKKLVYKCFKLGLSVSYDHVYQIITKLGNSVCTQYKSDQLICPPILYSSLVFTVAAVDNIDHNPSSDTAKASFYLTAISQMQFPEISNLGAKRYVDQCLAEASCDPSEIVLPLSYYDVPPCVFPKTDPVMPPVVFISQTIGKIDYQC